MLTSSHVKKILTSVGMPKTPVGDPAPVSRWQLRIGEQRRLPSGGVAWTGRMVRDDGVEVHISNDGRGSINQYAPAAAASILRADAIAVFPGDAEPEATLVVVAEVYSIALARAQRAARQRAS